ncbi:MAG: gliding motility-associated C-terminal domain-containing protein [Bacteroidota bacterium]
MLRGNSGSISLNVTGGTPQYGYNWSDGSTSELFIAKPAGIYEVTVTDANSCTAVAKDTIHQPDSIDIEVVNIDTVVCYGDSDGAIDIEVSGGNGGYTYKWLDENQEIATTQDVSQLTQGTYWVNVSDQKGCPTSPLVKAIEVGGPEDPVFIKNFITDSVKCHDEQNGAIEVVMNRSIPEDTYEWSKTEDPTWNATGSSISNVSGGTYHVTVTYSGECQIDGHVELPSPDPLSLDANIEGPRCFDGNGYIEVDTDGGTPFPDGSYQYEWSTGHQENVIQNLYGDSTYSVTVSDKFGCTVSNTYQMPEAPDPLVIEESEITYPFCERTSDGAIRLVISGPPHQLTWSDQSLNGSEVRDLSVGKYTVTISSEIDTMCHIDTTFHLSPENQSCVNVPTAFSPNGDGVNDKWKIKRLRELYGDVSVKVFNRWGEIVYQNDSYKPSKAWDGTKNGQPLPVDSYHYVIDLGEGEEPLTG